MRCCLPLLLSAISLFNPASAVLLNDNDTIVDTFNAGQTVTHTFNAQIGDSLVVLLADTANTFAPRIDIYSPSGAVLFQNWQQPVAQAQVSALEDGVHTIQVKDFYGANAGDYRLSFARMPGANEFGSLSLNGMATRSLLSGDLDTYVIDVDAGDTVSLAFADVSVNDGLSPQLIAYQPDGSFWNSQHGLNAARIQHFRATESGRYTVLLKDFYGGEGDYEFHYALHPGANEGGLLSAGTTLSLDLTPADIDTFTFTAQAGDVIALSMTDTSNNQSIAPQLAVFRPDGEAVSILWNQTTAAINIVAPIAGLYSVQANDFNAYAAGAYTLYYDCTGDCSYNFLECNGKAVTVNLNLGESTTPGPDVVLGTPMADDIRGKAGDDTICGMGGNDFIHGNSGDDWIDGGEGVDNLRGGRGADIIHTGSGATVGKSSRAFGGYDDDLMYGGADDDDLRGGKGDDIIYGAGGNDEIIGNDDDDILYGQSGDDVLKGGVGENDELYGGNGGDLLNGGSGSNDLCDTGGDAGDTQSNCEI